MTTHDRVAVARERFTKHGKHGTPEYISWQGMRTRCRNPKSAQPQDYMLKGISICPEWESFESFLADMGEMPKIGRYSLDRIDNSKGYNKENCRWANYTTQSRNRDFCVKPEYRGLKYNSLTELAEVIGFPYYTLRSRLRRGWDVVKSLETPIRKLNKKEKEVANEFKSKNH